jgi:hypothetical protein
MLRALFDRSEGSTEPDVKIPIPVLLGIAGKKEKHWRSEGK